jgi:hypothetical protein
MAWPDYGNNVGLQTAKNDLRAIRKDVFQEGEYLKQNERYQDIKVTGTNFLKWYSPVDRYGGRLKINQDQSG